MYGWIIAIPSHGRSKSINANTLKALQDYNVPTDRIKVFVAPEEVEVYRSTIPSQIEIVQSVIGCIENRAFIRQYFPEGQHIAYMDDDLKGFNSVCDQTDNHATCAKMDKSNQKSPDYIRGMRLPDLCKFLTQVFVALTAEGAYLGGVYPINNPYFASHRVTTDLRYICGYCYFEINRHDFKLDYFQHAEDMERVIKCFIRDGKVLRFNDVMVKSGFYRGDGDDGGFGGLAESRTIEKTRIAMEKLAEVYPTYCKVKPPTKGNKFWNLTLLKQK
jgi:hypothetical protein